MKPMNWLYLYTYFLFNMLITLILIYYNKQYMINPLNNSPIFMKSFNWMW